MDDMLLLDIYCERGHDGLWAEPLNAVSNLAFLVAAWLAWRELRRHRPVERAECADLLALIALVAAIGIGSGLWHTFATPWAFLLDIVPIGLFISLYLLSFLVRVARAPWWLVAALFLGYQVLHFGVIASVPRGTLHGSVYYFPAAASLAAMAAFLHLRGDVLWRPMLAGFGLLACSLTFRTLDMPLCERLPAGTHFLWHVFNAALLYVVLLVLIRRATAPERVG